MNSKALGVVLLVVACFAAWFTLRGSGDIDPGQTPRAAAAGADRVGREGGAAELAKGAVDRPAGTIAGGGQPERTAAVAAEPDKGTVASVSIRGRVVDARGNARAGVMLSLSSWQISENHDFSDIEMPVVRSDIASRKPSVTTKDDGTFLMSIPADRAGSIELADDDLVFADDGPQVDGRKGDKDLGDVVALRSGAFQGVVQDEQGRPVPGVKVSATLGVFVFGTTSADTTDEKGAFSVGKLRPGSWNLRTASDKFQPTVQEFTLKAEERRVDLVVVVRPGQAVAGQVVDDRGVPVAGCKVGSKRKEARGGMDIERFAADEAATTDAQGFFTLSGLSGSAVTVRAFGSGYANAVARDVQVGTGNLLLRLERLAEVRGVLQAADGSPIAESQVRAFSAGRAGGGDLATGEPDFDSLPMGELATAKTAADGSFRIAGVRPGSTTVVAEGKGHRPARHAGLAVQPGQTVEDVRLVAQAGATARVKVTDQGGTPVAGAKVRVERPGQGGSSDGIVAARAFTAEADNSDQELSGNFHPYDGDLGSATTDDAGIAMVRGLPEGPAVVRASHSDHAEALPGQVSLPKAGAVDVTVALREPGFAEVVVVGPDRSPLAGSSFLVRGSPEASLGERRGITDAQGMARVGPLAPGEYTAYLARASGSVGVMHGPTFSFGGQSPAIAGTERPFQIVAGETARVEIVRPVLTRVHGVVTGVDGPVAGCAIELERSGEELGLPGFGELQTSTDTEGEYVFEEIENGKYSVHYGKPQQVVKSRADLDVPLDAPEYRLDLVVRSGKVRVQVCAKATSDPIEGAEVELRRALDAAGASAAPQAQRMMIMAISTSDGGGDAASMTLGTPRVRTGADGWAEIDDVPAGTYTVHIRHDGCAPVERAGQVVVERQTTDCGRVELERAGTVRGRVVAADGSPVSMAVVQCRSVDTQEWGEPELAQEGAFQFKERQAGRHILRARAMGGSGSSDPGPEVEVVVTTGQTTTTEVRLPAK